MGSGIARLLVVLLHQCSPIAAPPSHHGGAGKVAHGTPQHLHLTLSWIDRSILVKIDREENRRRRLGSASTAPSPESLPVRSSSLCHVATVRTDPNSGVLGIGGEACGTVLCGSTWPKIARPNREKYRRHRAFRIARIILSCIRRHKMNAALSAKTALAGTRVVSVVLCFPRRSSVRS